MKRFLVYTLVLSFLIMGILMGRIIYAEAQTVYVPDDYLTIQGAIDSVKSGATIIVRPGIYIENINASSKSFQLRSINPNDPNIVANTIIDGNKQGRVCLFKDHKYGVLDGFTIRNGSIKSNGSGVYFQSCGPFFTISNCIIKGNSTVGGYNGGGIVCGLLWACL